MLKTGASSWRLLAEVYPSGQKKTFQPADCGYSVWMLHFWVVQHWSLPISFADICEFGLAHGSFNFSNEHLWKFWLRDENLSYSFPNQHRPWTKKTLFFREWSSNPQLVAGSTWYIWYFKPGDGRAWRARDPRGCRTWALLWVDFKCCRETSVAGSA